MEFKDFAHRLHSVVGAGGSTDKFTKSLFGAILTDEGQDILEEYKASSYKGFFNGNTSIRRISNKINAYIEPMSFSSYIMEFSDAAVENICQVFVNDIPDIDAYNAGDKLAALFVSIIRDAAGAKKKSAPKGTDRLGTFSDVAPELTPENAGSIFFIDPRAAEELGFTEDETEDANLFQKYLDSATAYYSTKKTLLYAEQPHPFYDLYVCNDIRYRKFRGVGVRDAKDEKRISNATIAKLEAESKYVIIEGIGGIGKSMLLAHLFLTSAQESESNGITRCCCR